MVKVARNLIQSKGQRDYIVGAEVEMLAPEWLVKLLDSGFAKPIYKIIDGFSVLKGVKIGHEMAFIGDKIHFDGKWISVERR